MGDIRRALDAAIEYLTAHPEEARYTDSAATARLEEGLRFRVTGPGGEELVTDMPASVGGGAGGPSPGWLFRAALASCEATLIAMRADQAGVALEGLEVTVTSESDDRGILGMDPDVPAGPLSMTVAVSLTPPADVRLDIEGLVGPAAARCPVHDAIARAVPLSVHMA